MTKKNYEKAAKIVRSTRQQMGRGHEATVQLIEESFVELFKDDNPRFNEERFRFACNREVI